MKRKIIKIDQGACNGCGACVHACHEGAIGLVEGKAQLLSDHYCDGLGDCLPVCPTGAITFEEREAGEYDQAAVQARRAAGQPSPLPCGCPGSESRALRGPAPQAAVSQHQAGSVPSQLRQWPVQIKLAPVDAPYFDGADLLVAADCTAYAYGDFHAEFMAGRVTLVGCPKLDMVDYAEKLGQILRRNNIRSVTVARMQVPCCAGLARAVSAAMAASGKRIPSQVVVLTTDGQILPQQPD